MNELPPAPSHGTEALGFTIAAGMMFLAGALGAWARVAASGTQVVWSQRTVVDLLIGGCAGVLLPIFAPIVNPLLSIQFERWTVVQQAVLALILGGSGSFFWTAIGWRMGLIVTAGQAMSHEKPARPEVGVLKNKKPPAEPPL